MSEQPDELYALFANIDQLRTEFRNEYVNGEYSVSDDVADAMTCIFDELEACADGYLESARGDVETAKREIKTYASGYFRGYLEGS